MTLISWKQRLIELPHLQEMDKWPKISTDRIPSKKRIGYQRNLSIVSDVLNEKKFDDIIEKYGLSKGRLSQIMNACLGGDKLEDPPLLRALIPYEHLKSNHRNKPLPTIKNKLGNANAFTALMESVPGLKTGLDNMIVSKLKDKKNSQRIRAIDVFGTFKQLLSNANWPQTSYPYTSKDYGYESVRLYLKRRQRELELEAIKDTEKRTDITIGSSFKRALGTIQIDAHRLDVRMKIFLNLNDELIPLPISRIQVLVAIDVETECILGYSLAISKEVNQQDLLRLLDVCITPSKHKKLKTPELKSLPGSYFPSELDNYFPISFGRVQFDNAWVHTATSVKNIIIRKLKASVSLGHPACPTVRRLVESTFNYIEQNALHRFASTTGSHVKDPNKESRKNQKQVPMVSFQTVDEVIYLLLTEWNYHLKAHLAQTAPLKLYQHHCDNHFIRYFPKIERDNLKAQFRQKKVYIHWSGEKNDKPYINFLYSKYKGKSLFKALNKGKYAIVEYGQDIRTLQLLSVDGDILGDVKAPLSWQRFPHSAHLKRTIYNFTTNKRYRTRDPLSAYLMTLLDTKDQPSTAMEILNVITEFSGSEKKPIDTSDSYTNDGKEGSLDGSKDTLWSTSMANQLGN